MNLDALGLTLLRRAKPQNTSMKTGAVDVAPVISGVCSVVGASCGGGWGGNAHGAWCGGASRTLRGGRGTSASVRGVSSHELLSPFGHVVAPCAGLPQAIHW